MLELAALSVEAATLQVGLAVSHAVLARHVCLLLEFILAMCESAVVTVSTLAV